ncbi:MAG TPA: preprotein translocase subunit SecA, partial [Clostridiales bacterium]|nr:preprotein translocase subunit SecA [Clostridiales bacterium]
MSIFEKVFGTYSERQLKKIDIIAQKVESLSERYKSMSEEELKSTTDILKNRLKNGETLDDILPDAFAAVREVSTRVSGKTPFYTQILGGIVIHQGRIAEMKTGEGKTLMAAMPAYLNALTGEGVHIVTVNDYLAKYHSELMGNIYRFLGLTVGLIIHDLTPDQRRAAYAADTTYGTNNELGFDYLRDNMVIY